jgi:UBA-like domain
MNTLSTQDSNNDKIAAFMAVLACAHDEAAFFLESADWSVEAAVSLWLESGLGAVLADNHKRSRSIIHTANNGNHPYVKRGVYIEGLPEEWSAWVSATTGQIYFSHNETGHTQSNVPPGFADNHPTRSRESVSNGDNDYLSGMTREDDQETESRDRFSYASHSNGKPFECDSEGDGEGGGDINSVDGAVDISADRDMEDVNNDDNDPSPISISEDKTRSSSSSSSSQSAPAAGDLGNIRSYSDLGGQGGSSDSDRMF